MIKITNGGFTMRKYYAIVIVLIMTSTLLCWSETAHKTIALMTWKMLSAETQKRVTEFMPFGVDIVSASTWPDQIRFHRPDTKKWHYIELPVKENLREQDILGFKSKTGDDIVSQLDKCLSELKSGTA
ncbi:MAG: hypothetical protein JNL74_21985, partial [Fibrobacteres bacterium]|nr:hypothetical protein [Fibrobacterota bacterium]